MYTTRLGVAFLSFRFYCPGSLVFFLCQSSLDIGEVGLAGMIKLIGTSDSGDNDLVEFADLHGK